LGHPVKPFYDVLACNISKIIFFTKFFKNCWSRTNLCQLQLQLRLHSDFLKWSGSRFVSWRKNKMALAPGTPAPQPWIKLM